MSVAASTTSPQKWTGGWSGRLISSEINSFAATLPPLSTKQPFRLISVTVAFSRELTPSQRAGRFTLARGAALLSFSIWWRLILTLRTLRLGGYCFTFVLPQSRRGRQDHAEKRSVRERAST